jgi:hypothetical protein
MPIASVVAKQVRYKKEVTFNTAPGATGAQLLRRVESSLDIEKDTFKSSEVRSDYQLSDFRHGARKSGGSIKGELSPRTYADFIGAALRRDFATVTPIAGASITVAVGSLVSGVQQYTVTRAAGSFLTDGVKAGDVVRLSVGTFNVANINKNLYVVSMTATVLTVVPLNGVALVAEGPIASSTCTVFGKKTFAPTTGHTNTSWAVEHLYPDANTVVSELFTGVKVNPVDLSLPAEGMAGITIGLVGSGSMTPAASAYYTSPTAMTGTGINAGVNGVLAVGGQMVALITSAAIKIDGGYEVANPVLGSQIRADIFPGVVDVTGNFTAFFDATTFRDAWLNETELALSVVLSCDNSATSDFIAITVPRIKLSNATRSESGKSIQISCDFQALINLLGGAGTSSEQTTISMQDSAA